MNTLAYEIRRSLEELRKVVSFLVLLCVCGSQLFGCRASMVL